MNSLQPFSIIFAGFSLGFVFPVYLWYDINHIYLVWYPLRFLHQYSIRPVTWCRPHLKRLPIWSSSSISSTSSCNSPENDLWIWWMVVHELVDGWVIGLHYTKYVSNCLLDAEIGRRIYFKFCHIRRRWRSREMVGAYWRDKSRPVRFQLGPSNSELFEE